MDDRERWDAKYAGEHGRRVDEPDPFVLEALRRVPPGGRALDLAAGTGRHALALARAGFETHAWDVSPVGLALLRDRAREAGLAVETRAVDLLAEPWPAGPGSAGSAAPSRPDGEPADAAGRFDLVVCVLFLDRDLLARLHLLLRPGGHLVFTTVTTDFAGDRPPAPFRLERGELARGLPGLETVLASEEGGRAGLLARRPPGVRGARARYPGSFSSLPRDPAPGRPGSGRR